MRRKNSRWAKIIIIVSLIVLAALLVWRRNFFFSREGLLSLVLIVGLIGGLFVILNNVLGFFANTKDSIELFQLIRPSKRPLTPEEIRQNRENMLKNMELRIAQTLKSKLLTDEWLKLGFKFDPEQIATLEAPQEWHTNGEAQTIRRGTKPITIFDNHAASALLILGEPGSGKTITLFRLAQELVERAMKKGAETIPIVFNLASWAEKQPALDEWLMEQLERVYRVPERVAHYWLEHGALTLLLDGLDEIRDKTKREACVEKINDYRLQQNLTKIAVCSRIDEYKELTTQLELNGAIVIRELKSNEAKQFLQGVATSENNLLPLLETNEVVQQLAKRPLTLNILAIAARGLPKNELDELVDEPEQILPRLYDVYIEQMLQHRGEDAAYPPNQTKRWLAWLAYQMKQRAQKDILADTLKPDWLENTFLNWLIYGGFYGGFFGLFFGLFYGLSGGLIVGLLGGLAVGLLCVPIFGLFGGLSGVLSKGQIFRQPITRIQFVNISRNLRLTTKKFIHSSRLRLTYGLLCGLSVGLIYGLFIAFSKGFSVELIIVLGFALFIVLFFGLIVGLNEMKSSVISVESNHPTGPFHATWQAAIYLLIIFSTGGAIIFSGLYGLFGLEGIDSDALRAGDQLTFTWTIFDSLIGGVTGLLVGCVVMLQTMDGVIIHWVIKWLLARQGFIPVDLFPFLDFATERQLLVRPGGHYEFFHQTLQDHFAAMWENHYADEANKLETPK